MKTNKDLIRVAKESLSGNYVQAAGALIITGLIGCTSSAGELLNLNLFLNFALTLIIAIFVSAPLTCGLSNAFRLLASDKDGRVVANAFGIGFGENYFRFIGGYVLMYLIIILGCILFIVPGIIWGLAYSLTPFILKDNPELGVTDALTASRMAMKGKKAKLLGLILSIILIPLIAMLVGAILISINTVPWLASILIIVSVAACIFYFTPVLETAISHFYLEVKKEEK